MRAILIDPETKTFSEIQFDAVKKPGNYFQQYTDELAARGYGDSPYACICKLIMQASNHEIAEHSFEFGDDRPGDELYDAVELNRYKTSADFITCNNFEDKDQPVFYVNDFDHGYCNEPIHGRALVVHRKTVAPWEYRDLKITVEELAKRVTFTPIRKTISRLAAM